jgi:hypothetical protein
VARRSLSCVGGTGSRTQRSIQTKRVIWKYRRGFGYVVFEGPDFLIDWGVKNVRGPKDIRSLRAFIQLVTRFQPGVVVLEDTSSSGNRRRGGADMLLRQIVRVASRAEITVCRISRADVMVAPLRWVNG